MNLQLFGSRGGSSGGGQGGGGGIPKSSPYGTLRDAPDHSIPGTVRLSAVPYSTFKQLEGMSNTLYSLNGTYNSADKTVDVRLSKDTYTRMIVAAGTPQQARAALVANPKATGTTNPNAAKAYAKATNAQIAQVQQNWANWLTGQNSKNSLGNLRKLLFK